METADSGVHRRPICLFTPNARRDLEAHGASGAGIFAAIYPDKKK
jgi:hypothetical protein